MWWTGDRYRNYYPVLRQQVPESWLKFSHPYFKKLKKKKSSSWKVAAEGIKSSPILHIRHPVYLYTSVSLFVSNSTFHPHTKIAGKLKGICPGIWVNLWVKCILSLFTFPACSFNNPWCWQGTSTFHKEKCKWSGWKHHRIEEKTYALPLLECYTV